MHKDILSISYTTLVHFPQGFHSGRMYGNRCTVTNVSDPVPQYICLLDPDSDN
jgi:hypothetical protein